MNILASLGYGIATIGLLLGSFFGYHESVKPVQLFGSFLPVQTQKATLAGSGITISDTTIVLTKLVLPDGTTKITMANYGSTGYATLEPGTSKEENISFTGVTQNGSGTATLTGVTRGLSFVYPFNSLSANKFSHAGGSTLVFSNSSAFYGNEFLFANNNSTSSAVLIFGSTTPPRYDANVIAVGNQFVSATQLNNTAFQGGATSTESQLGLVKLADTTQAAAGTASSTDGAPLVLLARYATSTPGTNADKNVPITISGKIALGFLDFTKQWTFAATTSQACSNVNSNGCIFNGLSYKMPVSRGAANTSLTEDGSGNLSWASAVSNQLTTSVIAGETFQALTPVYVNTGTSTLLSIASSTPGNVVTIGAAARSKQAQQFIMGSPITMTRIIVNGDNAGGATLAMSISIQSDSGGNPSGTVLASTSVAANLWATTDEYHTIPLSYTFAAASTTYWMVFEPIAPNGVDQFDIGQAVGNPYPDGAQKLWNGSAWSNQAIDMGITFYGAQGIELGYLANGKATSTSLIVGFNKNLAGTTTSATVVTNGVLSGFTGLITGSNYYLSPTASGTIQVSGNHQIGRAISSTTLLVMPNSQ